MAKLERRYEINMRAAGLSEGRFNQIMELLEAVVVLHNSTFIATTQGLCDIDEEVDDFSRARSLD